VQAGRRAGAPSWSGQVSACRRAVGEAGRRGRCAGRSGWFSCSRWHSWRWPRRRRPAATLWPRSRARRRGGGPGAGHRCQGGRDVQAPRRGIRAAVQGQRGQHRQRLRGAHPLRCGRGQRPHRRHPVQGDSGRRGRERDIVRGNNHRSGPRKRVRMDRPNGGPRRDGQRRHLRQCAHQRWGSATQHRARRFPRWEIRGQIR
jgi:hypothetical protein